MITYLNSNDIQSLWWLLFTFFSNSYFIVESKIFSLNQIFSRQIARCSSCSVSLLTVFVLVTHYWENISWETVCFAPSSGQLSWAYLISTNAQRTHCVRLMDCSVSAVVVLISCLREKFVKFPRFLESWSVRDWENTTKNKW